MTLRLIGLICALAASTAFAYDNPVMMASELLGKEVQNVAGVEVGELEDLAIDPATGRVVYAVLGLGGFAGFGEERIAVPLSKLTVGLYEEVLIAESTRLDEVPLPEVTLASDLLDTAPIVDLVVDMEEGYVTEAVLHHAAVPFTDLSW